MNITSATFLKGVRGTDPTLGDGTPQVALVGRSNVGKSSVINSLAHQKDLARTSSFPGRTQQINIYHINNVLYLVDLPGYGYAKLSHKEQEQIQTMMYWYLLESDYEQKKVILVIDAELGPKGTDLTVLRNLEEHGKDIVIVANKVDKVKKSEYKGQMENIQHILGRTVIPYSAKEKIGVAELTNAILQ